MHRNQPISATNSLGSLVLVKILQVLIVDILFKVGGNPNRVLFGGGRYIRPEVIKLLQTVNCDPYPASSNLLMSDASELSSKIWVMSSSKNEVVLILLHRAKRVVG